MAYTSWSLVRQALSMAMPRAAQFMASRHCRASSSRGRMPAEKTTMSASRCEPSANTMRWRARAPSVICCVLRPVCTCTPRRSIWACSTRPPPSSTCTAIRRGRTPPHGFQAHVAQGLGAFQPQQAAANHHARAGLGPRGLHGFQVFDGAVHSGGAVAPRHLGQ